MMTAVLFENHIAPLHLFDFPAMIVESDVAQETR